MGDVRNGVDFVLKIPIQLQLNSRLDEPKKKVQKITQFKE